MEVGGVQLAVLIHPFATFHISSEYTVFKKKSYSSVFIPVRFPYYKNAGEGNIIRLFMHLEPFRSLARWY